MKIAVHSNTKSYKVIADHCDTYCRNEELRNQFWRKQEKKICRMCQSEIEIRAFSKKLYVEE